MDLYYYIKEEGKLKHMNTLRGDGAWGMFGFVTSNHKVPGSNLSSGTFLKHFIFDFFLLQNYSNTKYIKLLKRKTFFFESHK